MHGPFTCAADKKYVKWSLRIASVHGQRAPLPFLQSVEVFFPERPELKTAVLLEQPFELKRYFELVSNRRYYHRWSYVYLLTDSFEHDKDAILQKLRDTALQELCCGQHEFVERETVLSPRSDLTVCAIVTNIVEYDRIFLKSKANGIDMESNGNILKRCFSGKIDENKASPKRSKECLL
ncbi:Nad-dependent protein deacetylase srt1 [Thalictrum thalictroides]|uniref:Nad-dependent protein deacetylase srt1 n=1 Tax=Thalictrum thalictroides TaxID=46969 RepID=A0A7J6VSI4_THATH|nr:Nad-dependent protein deacetylase srt1 [Thalictrum thalictroides]